MTPLDTLLTSATLRRLMEVAYDALERYARGAPCLECEAGGVVLVDDPARDDVRLFPTGRVQMRAHCATCCGRGWVVVAASSATSTSPAKEHADGG